MKEQKTKLAFENEGNDFFKSNELRNGNLIKSVPIVEVTKKKKEITITSDKKIPKAVENYVKETEAHFKQMDKMIHDVCKQANEKGATYTQEQAIEMKLFYSKFKQKFSSVVNNLINYPNEGEQQKDTTESPKSDWDKSRIRIV